MEQNEGLARLEQFVEKLISSHNQLKNENTEMKTQLEAKQHEVAELQEKIKNLQEDRSDMHDRVTDLIGRIDEWEKVFDSADPHTKVGPESGDAKDQGEKSSSLFKINSSRSSGPAL